MNESGEKSRPFRSPPPPRLSMPAYARWVARTVSRADPEKIRKLKSLQERPVVRFEWVEE